uniref:Guanylate cyclase domain-containing protein n=1 Tax=Elaeophora elaphi TaxID=1147741 RepID=A0A0R3RW24_9BILA
MRIGHGVRSIFGMAFCTKVNETKTSQNPSDPSNGYTQMGCAQHCTTLNYALTEVRSYVFSNNYANNGISGNVELEFSIRKFSNDELGHCLGSQSLPSGYFSQLSSPHLSTIHSGAFDNAASNNFLDLQKRTHSLGSKTWVKALRKIADLCIEHTNADKVLQRAVSAVGRSGSNSTVSVDSSNHSRANSLDVGNSIVLFSTIKNVRKMRNDSKNLCAKVRSTVDHGQESNSKLTPTNDDEYVLPSFNSSVAKNSMKMPGNSSNRWIGTILERNASSSSSRIPRSQSPVSCKEKRWCGNNETNISSLSLETTRRSSVSKIAVEVACTNEKEYESPASNRAFVKDEQVDLQYATLHWHRSDAPSTSSRSNLHAIGGLIDKNYPKKYEYTFNKLNTVVGPCSIRHFVFMNVWSSTGYMGTGHKALFVWLLLLLALVFLVVYLDGGLDSEPSMFFMILGFFDILFLSTAVIKIMRHYQICGVGRRQYDMNAPYPVTGYVYPLEKRTSAVVFALLVFKITFEVLLYIRLKLGMVQVFWLAIPLWLFLVVLIIELTFRLFSIHNRPAVKIRQHIKLYVLPSAADKLEKKSREIMGKYGHRKKMRLYKVIYHHSCLWGLRPKSYDNEPRIIS